MKDIFLTGKNANLEAILANKDWRSSFLSDLTGTKISVKLNIPGKLKNNTAMKHIFLTGWKILLKKFNVLEIHAFPDLLTGSEGLLTVSEEQTKAKQIAIKFEEEFVLGRLFDVDIVGNDGKQLSRTSLGFSKRKCYVCTDDAKSCARSRKHSVHEIKFAINKMYDDYLKQRKNELISFAQRALLYEVILTPKPGLVDPVSNGSHDDMDIFTFIDSTISLRNYFEQLFDLTINWEKDLQELFQESRILGIKAENEMFLATKNVNTHKGAIFSLGILFIAEIIHEKTDENIQEIVKKMLSNLTKKDFQDLSKKENLTAGEKQFIKYGFTGIRGQAEAGFPNVFDLALPFLAQTTGSRNERLLDALMEIAEKTADSNLIKRAGNIEILGEIRKKITEYFALGGAKTKVGKAYLAQLDEEFIAQNLSLGGSADLLILTIFMGVLRGVI
ncbi:2-(5''-triphosphoribosyl)-3'-dephosphocoenzyme- A synthase [Lactococcus lactis subsp. lactis]|uniref:triphosphoribosyl-dephospho-CoA synthase CitG n=1 Tax=Lactococcus lactis TaxID=1358 RepID=UPI000512FC9A|nr:triphosphoribosyl-dephospho-CoA synthase CitG [Lactococcus lactis]KGF76230.1 2-(5''-triphosphoribosyl)-3'-dephosphocoenzyme- A synthase [Lactococcus lactis]KST92043.1 2-(5''-triphosphoribosyl)-3'-dephosphocoenzyme- A synthase [Lactococcus lactis subsp. lactis]